MRQTTARFTRLIVGVLTSLTLIACGGQGTVRGRITDGNGAQARALGGQGTLEAAATVTLSTVDDNGNLTVVGEASVNADGSYAIRSSVVGEAKMIIQALSAEGEVVASVILDQGLSAGQVETAAPMTSETTVEAEVFLSMLADAALGVDDIDTCDLKARIDNLTATAVAASADVQADIAALAQAIAAAQAAFFASLNTTAQATFDASVEAAASLAAELDAAADNAAAATAAYENFLSALVTAYEALGFDGDAQADAQVVASLSFSLTVDAQASVEVAAQAILHAQAYLGFAISAAGELLLEAAAAGDAVIQALLDASAQLRADLQAAADFAASAQAYADFSATIIVGDASVLAQINGGVDILGTIGVIGQTTIDAALGLFLNALDIGATFQNTANLIVDAYGLLDATVSEVVSLALSASGQATADASASIFLSVQASALAAGIF